MVMLEYLVRDGSNFVVYLLLLLMVNNYSINIDIFCVNSIDFIDY